MDKSDFRAELKAARHAVSAERTVENIRQATLCCIAVAEQNLQAQIDSWQNAALAREVADYAAELVEHSSELQFAEQCLESMCEALYEHPRLKLELMSLRYQIIKQLSESSVELEAQIELYQDNIEAADSGRLEDVRQTTILKHDPVEWTKEWEEVIDDVDKIVEARLADHPRGMGFCHALWHLRAEVLSEQYGIQWRSPARMNPRVMFD